MDVETSDQGSLTTAAAGTRVSTPAVTFESITFSDGTTITLDPDDIVVFVGPNNAGKSAALKDLETHIGPPVARRIVASAHLRRTGSADDLRQFLESQARKVGDPGQAQYQGFRFSITANHIEHYWQSNLEPLRQFFCLRIPTETRITDSNPQGAISILDQPASHPIHLLYADDRIERRISSYFRRAFGRDLIVFHAGGSTWPLLVGDRPEPRTTEGEDRVSATYIAKLREAAPPLHEQGDGMRSFASVILHLLSPTTPSVLLLDEPEAFLHPPQARLLGEFIARERPAHAQLFVATHSPDVLQGLLNAAPAHLRVVRIQREGMVNRVKELDKTRAKEIAGDPIMKFSSVMSGIFHQRVVICESDADCMFYSAVLNLPAVRGPQQPDVLFVQAGGKHRMATLAEALRSLDVDVDVIADIDVLNDTSLLQRTVLALGGDWTLIQAEAGPLKAAIEQHKPWLNAVEVSKEIQHILVAISEKGKFPRSLRQRIEALFRKASPWDAVKDAGQAAIPAGQPMQHYQKLRSLCSSAGLWIVPVGELEGFCKSVGGHGPRWVQQVLEGHDLAADPELAPARNFVQAVWSRRNPRRSELRRGASFYWRRRRARACSIVDRAYSARRSSEALLMGWSITANL